MILNTEDNTRVQHNSCVHPKFIKYHLSAVVHPDCVEMEDCVHYMGCGPHKNSCVWRSGVIPCASCKIWTGYAMKDWELDNMVTMMEIMLYGSKDFTLEFKG